MISKHQSVEEAFSNIQTTLQRRYDLIPNLVNTVKGYAKHEKETLSAVIEARAKAMNTIINVDINDPQTLQKIANMQGTLEGALSKLMAVAEAYPDLKASQNFINLQSQLEGTENRINVARTRYNKVAKEFNTIILKFPGNLVNNLIAGFDKAQYFKASEQAQQNVKVQF
jgi:LemA protein